MSHHSSDEGSLCLIKWSRKNLQNLLELWNTKTHVGFVILCCPSYNFPPNECPSGLVWKPSTDAVYSGMNYLVGPNTENTEFLKHCKWIHLVVTHPLCILSKYYSIRHTTYLHTYISFNQKSNQIIWKDYISYICCNLDRICCSVVQGSMS